MGKRVYESLPDLKEARKRSRKPSLIEENRPVPEKVARFAEGRTYLVKTFGCQANVRDEEILSGYLEKAGFAKAKSEEEANLVIINTCAVRENAEEKVYGEIGKFKKNHKADKDFILGVCGCMMQEEGVAKKLMASYPYINLIFGTHNLPDILDLLDEHLSRGKDIVNVKSFAGDVVENLPSTRLDAHRAYVNITYGCDKFCTYCIVPYTRGRERSRPLKDILKECQALYEEGYQEVTLLGQNVNSYGKDLGEGIDFATCLEEVAKIGIPRVRFMTSHPWDFNERMIEVIAKYPNIMKCIHLPVQSGSSEILRLMGRRYSRESYLALVKKIRERIPGVALTTDIIVGFPNESEEQFEETVSLCEEVRYDSAFTFLYSPRKGTPAAKMVDNVTSEEKHERYNRLLAVTEKTTEEASARLLGQSVPVLVDGPSKKDPHILSGYTEGMKLVNFPGPSYLAGEIVPVLIKENHVHFLIGALAEDPLLLKAKSLQGAMKKDPILKEYLSLSKQIEEDEGLKELRKKIESAQRGMMAASSDDEDYQAKKKEYLSLKGEYESHPLVKNAESLHDEAESLLQEIAGALS